MQINLNLSDKWQNLSSIESCYLQGHILNIEEKESSIYNAQNIENWADVQNHLNGFYSLVKLEGDTLFAAVDHIRSYPLFYAQTDSDFYLSDSAEWIRKQLDLTVMDEFAKAEFQLTGYVTGNATLYKPIKQLQAGECLLLSDRQLNLNRYYTFTHIEPKHYDKDSLLQQLDKAAKLSIQNLIDYADGRQIVVPLSGGYDSRLIATLLKEANYDNILTFTYGVKGNKEAEYSKIVADSLGLKWHFIEYTKELWQSAWRTDERKDYQLKASNWVSLPHLQDWLAIKEMRSQNILDKNAIIVPGHTGDFISGGHIPKGIYTANKAKFDQDDVSFQILTNHYSLTPLELTDFNKISYKNKIKELIKDSIIENNISFADTYERWEWQERQAKFIVNSIQVYDFYDYDWWIPLWDKNFIKFFESLPLALRNHTFYQNYVQSKFLENRTNIYKVKISNAEDLGGLRRLLSKTNIIDKLKEHRKIKKIYVRIFKHNKANLREVVYNEELLKSMIEAGYYLNGRTAYFFLEEFKQ